MLLRFVFASLLYVSFCTALRLPTVGVSPSPSSCFANATWEIVESIPMGVNSTTNITTTQAWLDLFGNAQYSIDIAAYYWNLSNGSLALGGGQGQEVYQALIDAHTQRGVQIRIVQQEPSTTFPDLDSAWLAAKGIATVLSLNWTEVMQQGILHTKLIIVDQRHVYIGSANMDWASLTQVKELGIVIKNCPLVADDARSIFDMYYEAANLTKLPQSWPQDYDTEYDVNNPFQVTLNDQMVSGFIASSPNQFCTQHRTPDLDAVLDAIAAANQSICISVMDYLPSTLYMDPPSANFYWGPIDQALRQAAFRGVSVRLLASHWIHSSYLMFPYLASLNQLYYVEVKLYTVPNISNPAPFTRVGHAKYMVTDKVAYIGTNNWTGDYYVYTGGMSITTQNDDLRGQLQETFDRDWYSPYASFANNTDYDPSPSTRPPARLM
jgi:phospholipase D3/4